MIIQNWGRIEIALDGTTIEKLDKTSSIITEAMVNFKSHIDILVKICDGFDINYEEILKQFFNEMDFYMFSSNVKGIAIFLNGLSSTNGRRTYISKFKEKEVVRFIEHELAHVQ